MCNMDKCNQNEYNKETTDSKRIQSSKNTKVFQSILDIHNRNTHSLKTALVALKNKYSMTHTTVKFLADVVIGHYIVFPTQSTVLGVTKNDFIRRTTQLASTKHYRVKFERIQNLRIAIVLENSFKPESVFSYFFTNVTNYLSSFSDTYTLIGDRTADAVWIIIDVASTLLELRDGWFSMIKIINLLTTMLSVTHRCKRLFKPQTLEGPALLASLCLPKDLMNMIKDFSSLTGKRIFDSNIFMDIVLKFLSIIRRFLLYLAKVFEGTFAEQSILHLLIAVAKFSGFVSHYNLIKEVIEQYSRFMANSAVLFDPRFRTQVLNTYEKCKANESFMEMASTTTDRHFTTTWNNYKSQLVVSITAFESSKRTEPVCLVLQGEAGSGKSVLMNNLVDTLRMKGHSVYVHTVPTSEDAKDFYDDYNNQDVFVMDDVGAQGKSQWRTIVNFVSPVKVPLPCATASLKNTKFFNSKIIICTTNHFMDLRGFTSADCIAEPEALFRRAHVFKVARASSANETFAQSIEYYKFDHKVTKTWVQRLLYHNANNMPLDIVSETVRDSVSFIWDILAHIVKTNRADEQKCVLTEADVVNLPDIQFSPESISSLFETTSHKMWAATIAAVSTFRTVKESYSMISSIFGAFVSYWTEKILAMITEWADEFLSCFCIEKAANIIVPGVALVILYGLYQYFSGTKVVEQDPVTDALHKAAAKMRDFSSESLEQPTCTAKIEAVREHHTRICVFKNKEGVVNDTCCGLVTGKHIILPLHVEFNRIDIYKTLAHYDAGHKEREDVDISLVYTNPRCDMAIYKMNLVFAYRTYDVHRLFPTFSNPRFYYVNPHGLHRLTLGATLKEAKYEVTYSTYRTQITLTEDKWETPFSAPSLCGSLVLDCQGNLQGFHVAGDGSVGIAARPGSDSIRVMKETLNEKTCFIGDPDSKIHPNISGFRIRYEKDAITAKHVSGKTSLTPTIFHESNNPILKDLKNAVLKDKNELTPVPRTSIREKHPPVFNAFGTPQTTMQTLSKKSFKHQGFLSDEELEYAAQCIDSLLCDFDDLDLQEAVFGNEDIRPIAKDTANGYGYLPDKKDYFDYENKVILPTMHEKLKELDSMAKGEEPLDPRAILTVESFKDELRTEDKLTAPRTFRIMPLAHIVWSKRIFGNLLAHLAKHRLTSGVGIGINPYLDFDYIAKAVKVCDVTGDIDFSKWDGSIMRRLMDKIGETLAKRYKGSYTYMPQFLVHTAAESVVLVGDELWATTHGLPSGCWFTLMMNCFINKALSAITIYRNKKEPTVRDFQQIVDYVVGDDKLIGASGELATVFNLRTIAEVANSLGMTCTNGDKTPISHVHQPFEKLTFTKRHFHFHPVLKKYVGVLDVETMFGTLQYYDMHSDGNMALEGKMRAVQMEAYLHSEALFRAFTEVFTKTCPMIALFTDRNVQAIMEEGRYEIVANGMRKFDFTKLY